MANHAEGEWILSGNQATIRNGEFQCKIDIRRPDLGLQLTYQDQPPQQLLAIDWIPVDANENLDPYQRGRDLIINYPVSEDRPVGSELYWRANSCAATASESPSNNDILTVEMILSLETDLLDSHPDPNVVSNFTSNSLNYYQVDPELNWIPVSTGQPDANAYLCQHGNCQTMLVVIPEDLQAMRETEDESADSSLTNHQIKCQLDPGFLEKGVIRRYRLLVAIGTAESKNDLQVAANHFLQSAVPLTA